MKNSNKNDFTKNCIHQKTQMKNDSAILTINQKF